RRRGAYIVGTVRAERAAVRAAGGRRRDAARARRAIGAVGPRLRATAARPRLARLAPLPPAPRRHPRALRESARPVRGLPRGAARSRAIGAEWQRRARARAVAARWQWRPAARLVARLHLVARRRPRRGAVGATPARRAAQRGRRPRLATVVALGLEPCLA